MKKFIWTIALVMMLTMLNPALTDAQFRQDHNAPTISEQIGLPYSPSNSSLVLGFIDLSRLDMQQSYSVSFSSAGGQSGAMGLYTNRLSYMISPKMQLIADIAYMHQPFQSIGNSGIPFNLDSGKFFYGGELRYKPTENSLFTIRLDNMPRSHYYRNPYFGYSGYRGGYYPYSPFYGY